MGPLLFEEGELFLCFLFLSSLRLTSISLFRSSLVRVGRIIAFNSSGFLWQIFSESIRVATNSTMSYPDGLQAFLSHSRTQPSPKRHRRGSNLMTRGHLELSDGRPGRNNLLLFCGWLLGNSLHKGANGTGDTGGSSLGGLSCCREGRGLFGYSSFRSLNREYRFSQASSSSILPSSSNSLYRSIRVMIGYI